MEQDQWERDREQVEVKVEGVAEDECVATNPAQDLPENVYVPAVVHESLTRQVFRVMP